METKVKTVFLAEAITKFSIEVLQLDETKNSPEMVAAITELLKISRVNQIIYPLKSNLDSQEKYPEWIL